MIYLRTKQEAERLKNPPPPPPVQKPLFGFDNATEEGTPF